MKIIITEQQYERVKDKNMLLWIKRRYGLIKKLLNDTFDYTEDKICYYDTYENFEDYFFYNLMDNLHPYFYVDESFNYDEVFSSLMDLFYVECTEFYFEGREKC